MVIFNSLLFSQTNLIKNGSFEGYIEPPNWATTGGGFFDYSFSPEQRIVLDWNVFNSADYFSTVCTFTYTYRGVPNNTFGVIYPKHGVAYSGIEVYYDNSIETKEYIYQEFLSPLEQDSVYCVSFFVSCSDRTTIAIQDIGAYFSTTVPNLISNSYINAIPQVNNNTGFLTDTVNWININGCFTALGGEKYITIGNFNSNFNTDTIHIKTNNPFPAGSTKLAYYYVDSISLWRNNFPTAISEGNKENSYNVYPNPTNGILNFEIKDLKENTHVEIINTFGEIVLTEHLPSLNSALSTHQLKSGIYFYRILVNGNVINTNKIVIIK